MATDVRAQHFMILVSSGCGFTFFEVHTRVVRDVENSDATKTTMGCGKVLVVGIIALPIIRTINKIK
jgi:hypothetical protein